MDNAGYNSSYNAGHNTGYNAMATYPRPVTMPMPMPVAPMATNPRPILTPSPTPVPTAAPTAMPPAAAPSVPPAGLSFMPKLPPSMPRIPVPPCDIPEFIDPCDIPEYIFLPPHPPPEPGIPEFGGQLESPYTSVRPPTGQSMGSCSGYDAMLSAVFFNTWKRVDMRDENTELRYRSFPTAMGELTTTMVFDVGTPGRPLESLTIVFDKAWAMEYTVDMKDGWCRPWGTLMRYTADDKITFARFGRGALPKTCHSHMPAAQYVYFEKLHNFHLNFIVRHGYWPRIKSLNISARNTSAK